MPEPELNHDACAVLIWRCRCNPPKRYEIHSETVAPLTQLGSGWQEFRCPDCSATVGTVTRVLHYQANEGAWVNA